MYISRTKALGVGIVQVSTTLVLRMGRQYVDGLTRIILQCRARGFLLTLGHMHFVANVYRRSRRRLIQGQIAPAPTHHKASRWVRLFGAWPMHLVIESRELILAADRKAENLSWQIVTNNAVRTTWL